MPAKDTSGDLQNSHDLPRQHFDRSEQALDFSKPLRNVDRRAEIFLLAASNLICILLLKIVSRTEIQ